MFICRGEQSRCNIVESWLCANILDAEVAIPGYCDNLGSARLAVRVRLGFTTELQTESLNGAMHIYSDVHGSIR